MRASEHLEDMGPRFDLSENELPSENGADIGYSTYRFPCSRPVKANVGAWLQAERFTGSDYSGGTVARSNYEVLCKLCEEHDAEHPDESAQPWWGRTSGGHGTYGLVFRIEAVPEAIAEAIVCVEDYPVLNDEHHSELERAEADRVWANCYNPAERIAYIRKHASQFEFRDMADLMGCVRGKYFAGYACELVDR